MTSAVLRTQRTSGSWRQARPGIWSARPEIEDQDIDKKFSETYRSFIGTFEDQFNFDITIAV